MNYDNQSTIINADYNSMPLDILCDHIENTHHKYVAAKSVEIKRNIEKLISQQPDTIETFSEVKFIFNEIVAQLSMHMMREELMLFPVIKKMVKTGTPVKTLFGSIRAPIETMLNEHDSEEERFNTIATLTHSYQSTEDSSDLHKETLAMLNEFHKDLLQHIHLENDILFPKSIILEEKINS